MWCIITENYMGKSRLKLKRTGRRVKKQKGMQKYVCSIPEKNEYETGHVTNKPNIHLTGETNNGHQRGGKGTQTGEWR